MAMRKFLKYAGVVLSGAFLLVDVAAIMILRDFAGFWVEHGTLHNLLVIIAIPFVPLLGISFASAMERVAK